MATRKQIINDWQQLFPELKKTGLLSLDNRLGPLITGIYIKVVRNTYYTPVAYVHNLCSEESGIITSLEYLVRYTKFVGNSYFFLSFHHHIPFSRAMWTSL